MIEHVRGRLLAARDGAIVLDAGGLGLRLRVASAEPFAGRVGRVLTVPAWLEIHRRGAALFGFATARERERFAALVALPGIGAATALKLLPWLDRLTADPSRPLPELKGIGPAKLARLARLFRKEGAPRPGASGPRERGEALRALGLPAGEARARAARTAARHPEASIEELVRFAVRRC
ncbi:MAG: hypothetical protein AAB368_07315 [bacterium]